MRSLISSDCCHKARGAIDFPLLRDHSCHVVERGGFALHIANVIADLQQLLPQGEGAIDFPLLRDHSCHLCKRDSFALHIVNAIVDLQRLLPQGEGAIDFPLLRDQGGMVEQNAGLF